MRLHEEIDLHLWVDVAQEVVVDFHEQLSLLVMVNGGPDRANLSINFDQVGLPHEKLLNQKAGEWLALLPIYIYGQLWFNLVW